MKNPERKKLIKVSKTCMSFNIKRASRIIVQHYDETLKPVGLRSTQISLLVAISLAEPVNINSISDAVGMDRTTALRNCRVLENSGYISSSSGEDKRNRILNITEKGRDILNESEEYWEKAQQDVMDRLGKEKTDELLSILKELSENFK